MVLEGFGGAGEDAGGPDLKDVAGLGKRPLPRDGFEGFGVDAEFFVEFAHEGVLDRLAGFDLAAGSLGYSHLSVPYASPSELRT